MKHGPEGGCSVRDGDRLSWAKEKQRGRLRVENCRPAGADAEWTEVAGVEGSLQGEGGLA